MKKVASYLILLLTVGLCGACSDVLDIDPTDRYSPASVWSDRDAVDKYVFGFYGMLKEKDGVYNAGFFSDAFSDIMKSSSWDQYNHSYNYVLLQDTYFTSDDARTFACWGDTYNRIFRLNIFLRDAPGYVSSFGQEFITTRMAEIRFFRGYCYYLMTRVYGGVVLRKAVDGPNENDKPRATEAESWQQAIDDITYAAENLPESWDASNSGRITKAAAYGMLSRVALYAKQWNLAVEAADLCKQYANDPLSTSYSDIFNNSANPENLLVLNFLPGYMESGITHDHDTYFRPVGDSPYHNKVSIKSAFGPTSELVDSYEMADGSEFSWESHGDDPYANREPRFYATVLYNGAKWEGRTIETFVGGADGLIEFQTSGAANASTTGYYFRKFLTEGETTWETKGSSHFAIFLRYGEVLLNKAEALAEADWNKNKTEALATLNRIRGRVGLPARTAASKEEFMELLRHERMVELAGEGFRYWDLRRWRLAVEVINGKEAHGVKITKNPDGTFHYEQIAVDGGKKRIFYERYYAFSLPLTEMKNNRLIGENNPGW